MVARLAKLVEKIRLIKSLSSSEKTNWPKNVVYAPSICCSFLVCCQQATLPILARNLPPFLFRLFCNCHWFVLVLFRRHVRHDRSLFGSRPKIYPKMKNNNKDKKETDCHFLLMRQIAIVFCGLCVWNRFLMTTIPSTQTEKDQKEKEKNDFLIGILHGSNMVIIIIDTVGVGWCQREYSRSSMKNPHIHTQ